VLAVANVHPEVCVALAAAVRDGRDDEAERRQAELVALEDGLRTAGGIPAFKRAVADRLADRGAAYSAAARGPLAGPAGVPAAAR
jgi:dihydrodipicolinate synthase/N-acetylneuraminate lyase